MHQHLVYEAGGGIHRQAVDAVIQGICGLYPIIRTKRGDDTSSVFAGGPLDPSRAQKCFVVVLLRRNSKRSFYGLQAMLF